MTATPEQFSDLELDVLAEDIDANPRVSAHVARSLVYTARQLALQRRYLARLASDTPQFNNPLDVIAAQQLRDEVLRIDACRRTKP